MVAGAPKVTVIIPTYNRAHYLGEAIRSVLDQSFADLELIVVDDGSTDGTDELVRAIADRRVLYLHQSQRGISAAMNAGVDSARAKYIARLDSDDRWLPDMLATLVPVLDTRPEIGAVYAQGQAMDREGRMLTHVQGLPLRFEDDSLRSIVYDDCTCNITVVARRECFERAGRYDETLIANEDWDMWLRVSRNYRFAFVDKVVASIRWHDGNLTGPASPHFGAVLETRTAPLDKLFRDPDLPAAVRAMRPTAYANVHLFCGQRWLTARRYRKAARELGLALRVSDRRLTTALQILWLGLVAPIVKQSAAGRRALGALASTRRRWRAMRDARQSRKTASPGTG